MPIPEMRSVFSSHVDKIGWNEDGLWVTWDSGKTSLYAGVPEELARQVMNAPSVGSVLHSQIKPSFSHRYIA